MKPIPEMTDQELSEAIAVEVRGWHEGDISGRWLQSDGEGTNYYNHDRTDLSDWGCVYFDPCDDLNQALESVDKSGVEIHIHLNYYLHDQPHYLEVGFGYIDRYFSTLDELPRAICEALLQAVRSER